MKVLFEKDNFVYNENLIENISLKCGILKDTARLLIHRNIDSVEKAKVFLNPSKRYFYSPFLLNGMDKAKNRIEVAKERGETILIFGDYDADGICASTVLYNALNDFGVKSFAVVPERDDGYGLNTNMIKKILEKTKIDLIITVDCGISDKEKIEDIKSLGLDIIVTDHHEPPEDLPNCVCINPKIDGQEYPFNGLCGAGVAYKLAVALIGEKANDYLDFVSLATVADSMDLIDENRNIVYEGLKLYNSNKLRPCFKYLLNDLGKQITAQTLAFSIAPRVNAGGRMGDANSALNLFLEDNETERYNLAIRLNTYNLSRQAECDNIYNQAKSIIKEKKLYNDSIILVYNEEWKTGFVGIVAAKLVEEYSRPVIAFAGYDGYLKGSARSVDGVNIFEAISSVKDLLVGFGGHSQAAGVSIEKKNFSFFKKKLLTYIYENYESRDIEKTINAEWNIEGAFSTAFAKEIEMLEPFGVGNKRPIFTTQSRDIKASPLNATSTHISMFLSGLEMLEFNGIKDLDLLNLPIEKQIVFETNVSTFKGKEYVKGYVKNIIPSFEQVDNIEPYLFDKNIKALVNGGSIKKLNDVVDNFDIDKHKVGLCFVASSFTAINDKYKGLPTYLFYRDDKKHNNCVIVCPNELPTGFEKIIYLDNPYFDLDFEGEGYTLNIINQKIIDNISIKREDIVSVFMQIKALCGKQFISLVELFRSSEKVNNIYQFIFAYEVFSELNIFTIKNGILKQNEWVKSDLVNSKIYNYFVKLKG